MENGNFKGRDSVNFDDLGKEKCSFFFSVFLTPDS
jgi:hypothetical protein